jgi:hypothetical protein
MFDGDSEAKGRSPKEREEGGEGRQAEEDYLEAPQEDAHCAGEEGCGSG